MAIKLEIRPFYGVVEKLLDNGYVRVRIFGIHPFFDKKRVDTDFLPPALVLLPTTGGHVDSGEFGHNLQTDSWVRGEILDYPICSNLVITHSVKGGTYSMNKTEGGDFTASPREENIETENTTPENTLPAISGEAEQIDIQGGSNIEKAYNYAYDMALKMGSNNPHLHASALVGVLMLETTGINPDVRNSIGAYGICQWLGPRRKQLFARYGERPNFKQQLDFMQWELNGTEKRARGKWLSATNLPDAVEGFCHFERAEEMTNGRVNTGHSNYKKRLKFAQQIYQQYRTKRKYG